MSERSGLPDRTGQSGPGTFEGGGGRLGVPALGVHAQQRGEAVGQLLLRHVFPWAAERKKVAGQLSGLSQEVGA